MNNPRRIQRHLVKALAAGALVAAAALPMAIAGVAGAAPAPTSAWMTTGLTGVLTTTGVASGATSVPLSSTVSETIPAGDLLVDSTTGGVLGTTTGATAVTTGSGPYTGTATISASSTTAASGDHVVVYAPASFGPGGSGTLYFSGTGFANNGGTVTVTSNATGVTFSSAAETSSTFGNAAYTSTSATAPGTYTLSVADSGGATATPAASAFTVTSAPTVTAISATSVGQSQQVTGVTVTGSGFAPGATATLTSTTNGTNLVNTLAYASSTTLTGSITGTTAVGSQVATAGTYTLTVKNTDGGTGSLANAFTVTTSGITNVSPSNIPATATATPITINGSGFQPGAVVTISGAGATNTTVVSANTVVVSPTTITTALTTAGSSGLINVIVTNPSSPTGNGAVITGTGVLGAGATSGIGGAAISAATLSPNAPIVVGTSSTTPETLTITGSGFSSLSTVQALYGTTPTLDSHVVFTCTSNSAGTTLTCSVAVNSGAVAGVDGIQVTNGGVASAEFANALTVAGPVIVSSAPTALAVGTPVGTVITFTGTGFSPTATATVGGGTGLAGTFAVTSPTTATFAVTTAPTTAGTATITLSQTVSAGNTVTATPFSLSVNAAPTVTSLVNANTSAVYVGAGAVNVPVTITGTGFAAGATIGKFVNAYNVADPGVTATVKTVTPTSMTVLVSIAPTDTNLSDGYTITNTDGGTVSVAGFTAGKSLFISVAPTITSVTPASGTASGTTAFTITGTGFVSGAVVTTTPTNGTCGVTTFVSSTSLTVNCTLGVAGTSPTALLVTNPDGGSATSAAILAAATPPPVVTPPVVFHVTAAHGYAVPGKTVHMTISGRGFYGQPRITSTAAGTRVTVSKDSGSLLTINVTTKANTKHRSYTFTIRLANGKAGKANYSVR